MLCLRAIFLPKSIVKNLAEYLTLKCTYWRHVITLEKEKRVFVRVYIAKSPLNEILAPIIVEYNSLVFPRFRYGVDVMLEIFKLRRHYEMSFEEIALELNRKYKHLKLRKGTVKRLYDFVAKIIENIRCQKNNMNSAPLLFRLDLKRVCILRLSEVRRKDFPAGDNQEVIIIIDRHDKKSPLRRLLYLSK